jgi:predicted RNA-binding Zn ribbon-like protein
MQQLPAILIGDAQALDFLNSAAAPVDVAIDWLEDGEGLLSWLQQARLVPAAALERMRSQSSAGELNKVARQARNLREWFRGFVHEHKGRPLRRDALRQLEPLNRLLERDDSFFQVASSASHDGNAFELRAVRLWRSSEALLFPIAETIAHFVCSEDFTYVKACEGPPCTLLFADHTRSRGRRWCSMAICGNRAKQAAHRHRLKADRDDA